MMVKINLTAFFGLEYIKLYKTYKCSFIREKLIENIFFSVQQHYHKKYESKSSESHYA